MINSKYEVILFVIGLVIFFSIAILYTNNQEKELEETYRAFDVTFSGLILQKKDTGERDACELKVKIIKSNKSQFKSELYGLTIKGDTAILTVGYAHCINANDSITIGPYKNLIVKRINDTIVDELKTISCDIIQ